ncbi:hypothetical protein Lqui_2202 [Legionella quinlivanii]|uniref:Uncharacterized protein n=1 Tax=Legionella quinlivanii TaxID=45073 RepID=A0A0W0XU58_9GAMM|nr:hypothetical protein [Legionella quinlivanii]KTD47938.1 hypothetical protein Lqui_2202 [Legionella quinlivanii]SEG19497.1 hypothetical protein SAMN02746093_02126 [Legionella quinlivanii DSM 21216]STY11048.1 Uncharacterised protein [Legionella quinlivanii]
MALSDQLFAQIGIYQQPHEESNYQLVNRLLSTDAQTELYAGVGSYQDQHREKAENYLNQHNVLPNIAASDPEFFRKLFIQHVEKINSQTTNQYKVGDPDTRGTNPEQATITMESFLNKEGAELYRLALEEEMNSKEYREAVFSASTTHYEGEKWSKRAVVIVAGPSSSGKTVSAVQAVKTTAQFMPKVPGDMSGNDVVAVDGGVAREVSQIRKLAIQASIAKGYTGIKDLHEQSAVLGKAKDRVQEALFKTDTGVGVVIPETFSMWIKPLNAIKKLMPRIETLPNTKHVFCRVEGEEPGLFQKVVSFLGSRRAWKTDQFDSEQKFDMNSNQGIPESKAYGASGFKFGDMGSRMAEKWFESNSKDKLRMVVINDMILVKPNPNGQKNSWIPAEQNDKGAIAISKRAFDTWTKNPDPDKKDLKSYSRTSEGRPPPIIKTSAEIDLAIAYQSLINRRLDLLTQRANILNLENKPEKAAMLTKKIDNIELAIKAIESPNLTDKHSVEQSKTQVSNVLKEMQAEGQLAMFFSTTKKALETAISAFDKTSSALENSQEKKAEPAQPLTATPEQQSSSEGIKNFSSFKNNFKSQLMAAKPPPDLSEEVEATAAPSA